MSEVTVLEALTLIGANEPTTLQYFGARRLLDPNPSPSSVWASERMRHKLQQRYKKNLLLTSRKIRKRRSYRTTPSESGVGRIEEILPLSNTLDK